MAKQPSDRNTKAEILAAYSELAQEKAALEAELRQAKRDLKSAPVGAAPMEPTPASAIGATSGDETIDVAATIEQLMALQTRFSGTIGQLSDTLTRDAISLRDLQSVVTDERDDLAALHEITELADDTLATLVQNYQDCDHAFTETFEAERETLDEELAQIRRAWETEQEEHDRAKIEADRDYVTRRDRDRAEYDYQLQLERSLDDERYQAERSAQYRELDEQREALERQWLTREEALAKREQDYRELKEKVEAHKEKLEAEKKRGEEVGRNIAKRQAQVAADLRAKDIEGATQRYELRVQSLQTTLANEEAKIDQLNQQLAAALKQVQDLAVKAIEGAANEKSLRAVKDIALEQAKNQPRSK